MAKISQFTRVSEFEWQLPVHFRQDMNVPVTFFADEAILNDALEDKSIEQAINAACLPGLAGDVIVMPDVHQGYGFPIGGIAASNYPEGIISPGAIGYDINCGVRLLSSGLEFESVRTKLDELANALYRNCPCGMGAAGNIHLNLHEIKAICEIGAQWAVREGMGSPNDLEFIEENGCLKGADFSRISERAIERGKQQMGTLGSGNHFIEVDLVDEVFDTGAANLMGIYKGCLTLMIHCGSRGLGHQVCTDYVQSYQHIAQREKYPLPDRELVYAGITTREGQAYMAAMKCAANYAFCNRQALTFLARRAFHEVFGENDRHADLGLVYDLAHNIGKIENHNIHGINTKVCVHRKGATRAFGPNSLNIPLKYQKIGQPVFIPGSMGSASWVLTGTEKTMEATYGSLCHGAGRVMSRHQAKREVDSDKMHNDLSKKGVHLRYHSRSGLVEEAPQAYKDVDEVIKVVTQCGLAKKVARLLPVIVIKG